MSQDLSKKQYKCVKTTIKKVVKTTKSLTIFSKLKDTKIVNQEVADKLVKLTGERIIDLVMHVPVNYELWYRVNSLMNISAKNICCIETVIDEIKIPKIPAYIAIKRHIPITIKTTTFDGYKLDLVFFNIPPFILTNYKIGHRVVCQGRLLISERGKRSMTNPSITSRIQHIHGCMAVYKLNQLEYEGININKNTDNIVPIYSITSGIKQNQIISLVDKILNNDRFDFSPLDACDYILKQFKTSEDVPIMKESLIRLHFPKSIDDIENNSKYLKKIAFLELISFHYSIIKARKKYEKTKGNIISGSGEIRDRILKNLPFSLTYDQQNCLNEIYADQASEKKMLRLLQGDVGSGKTIVAIMAALNAIESGYKVVIIAPTTMLAKQHFTTISKICFGLGISVELLIGKTKQKIQKDILTRMNSGQIDILVGTHALFQEKIELSNVGLFIIDEQHNFGVEQRVSLIEKCKNADVLMMSATPIPRTMIMGIYGDIGVSCIKNKPNNRNTIDTRILNIDEKYNDLVDGINRKIIAGEKVYWICPLVEESEALDYIDVMTRAKELEKNIDKTKIGILHGKMDQNAKDSIMNDFKNGIIQLLVATTVIEVGIDVPDATIIVIENAEKFGLAQLHQLRGRVGRGTKQSYCFLLYSNKISDIGKSRLCVLKKYNNGFDIAKLDLKMRGGGGILDKKQSGKIMNFVDFLRDEALISFLLSNIDINNIDNIEIEPIISLFYTKNSEKLILC